MVERLKTNVWYMNRCCECGACISTCQKNILVFPGDGDHPVQKTIERSIGLSHVKVDTCFFCEKTCEESCPRLREWDRGPIIRTATVVSRIPEVDAINALLIALIRRKIIDGAILWDIEREDFKSAPKIATTEEEILKASGYQHIWYPILQVLNKAIYKEGLKKIAVVGPPCIAEALKAIRTSNSDKLKIYKDSLYLVIGFFCEGAYTHLLVQEIENRFGIKPYELNSVSVDLKNKALRVILQDGLIKGIPLSEVRKYMKQGCARCTDFLGEWADISIGRVDLDEERSLAIVRTPMGDRCLDYAFMEKTLKLSETSMSLDEIKKFMLDKERRKRVQEIDSLTSSMLKSMFDLSCREDVKEMLKSMWR